MSDLTDRLLSASFSLPGEMIEIKDGFVHDNVCTEAANHILEIERELKRLQNKYAFDTDGICPKCDEYLNIAETENFTPYYVCPKCKWEEDLSIY